jgi:UDP-N-acetylmuramate: L-alanyl-gamma-D-glutamyl-meso-diaminopimelate ligase
VFGAEKFPPDDRLDPGAVVASLRADGREAIYIEEVDRIVEHLASGARPGDLILLMSNGGFGGIQGKLARALADREGVRPATPDPP